MPPEDHILCLQDIREAADRITPFIHRTPVLTCSTLDEMTGAKLFFKCENFQKVGAFKIRGATNAVQSLSNEIASRGVASHSSGNHAAALAQAARTRGISAHIIMPENSPQVKKMLPLDMVLTSPSVNPLWKHASVPSPKLKNEREPTSSRPIMITESLPDKRRLCSNFSKTTQTSTW